MSRTLVAILAPVLALTLTALPTSQAWSAKHGPRPAASKRTGKNSLERARKEFRLGKKEAELGHFERAITHFEKAYELEKVPAVLFNIGQCQRYLKNYDRALYFFEAYLREEPDAPDRKVVESDIAETKRLRDEQLAAAAPPVETAPAESPAPSEATAATSPSEPNSTAAPELDAPAAATAAPSDTTMMLNAPVPAPAGEPTPVYGRWWFWAAVGGVAAAAAVTVILVSGNHDTLVPPAGSLGTVDAR